MYKSALVVCVILIAFLFRWSQLLLHSEIRDVIMSPNGAYRIEIYRTIQRHDESQFLFKVFYSKDAGKSENFVFVDAYIRDVWEFLPKDRWIFDCEKRNTLCKELIYSIGDENASIPLGKP